MDDYTDPEKYDALGQPLVLPSEEDARQADLVALIEHNLTLTPAGRLQKHFELMNFFLRMKRVAAKRYGRKIDIQVTGLS
jgi:hypothetical protein